MHIRRFPRRAPLVLACLLGLGSATLSTSLPASAQGAHASRRIDIPAGPLAAALNRLAAEAGISLSFEPALAAGKQSPGVRGVFTAQQALTQLLQGSGLTWRESSAGAFRIETETGTDGTIVTGTLSVSGNQASGESASDRYTPYETAAPTAHISGKTIERFRGSSPADIFRGTPGVMSGEARNGGGIDVNIRGMQGMGRVIATVDGAENAVNVYHGYQGQSNRTYVDPDLIAGIDVTKGTDLASRGIAGTVEMRTLNAGDIVEEGETFGARFKAEAGTNTSSPMTGARSGYAWPSNRANPPTPSADGLDRPALMEPTSSAFSLVGAISKDDWDFLVGYAKRRRGNYHAGSHGPVAEPVDTGPQTICDSAGRCTDYPVYYDNAGISNFRADEEVLNTEYESTTLLAKGALRFGDGHNLQFGYTNFRGEAGDRIGSALTSERGQAIQQQQATTTRLDTIALRHRWNPQSTDLVDLRANLWGTDFRQRNAPRNGYGGKPGDVGLGEDFLPGMDTYMWGTDVSNTSSWRREGGGSFDLTLGASWHSEDTRPSAYTEFVEGWLNLRNAERDEAAIFAKANWKPFDWLAVDAGLRHARMRATDRQTVLISEDRLSDSPNKKDSGSSPSIGVTIEPRDGMQFYARYSNALRFPSLVENSAAFTLIVNSDLKAERSRNIEIGANLQRDGLFRAGDAGFLKFGYFNWDVEDYISRQWTAFTSEGSGSTWWGMQVTNIDRAKFSGVELSGRYELGGFTADLAANYYLDIEYCLAAGNCASSTLYADYATNQVPPEYSIGLTLSQDLLDDRLTVGGRALHNASRAVGHGAITAAGLSSFISQIQWRPYTTVDAYAEYKFTKNLTGTFRVENLTDRYYVDPLGLVNQPGPGRTIYFGFIADLGGGKPSSPAYAPAREAIDWSGPFAGVYGAGVLARLSGATTALDGSTDPVSAGESLRLDPKAPQFGGQLGYNWDLGGGLVAGVIADIGKSYASGTITRNEDNIVPAKPAETVTTASETHYSLDWSASLRGRIGRAFDNGWMVYGSGGLARIQESYGRDQYRADAAYTWNPYGSQTALFGVERFSAKRNGLSLGFGAEYAINDRWSFLADYTFTRFRNKKVRFKQARAGTSQSYTETVSTQTGTRTEPPIFQPDNALCQDATWAWACEPREVPVYEYTYIDHPGAFDTQNGRSVSNPLETHTIKIGLNYRF